MGLIWKYGWQNRLEIITKTFLVHLRVLVLTVPIPRSPAFVVRSGAECEAPTRVALLAAVNAERPVISFWYVLSPYSIYFSNAASRPGRTPHLQGYMTPLSVLALFCHHIFAGHLSPREDSKMLHRVYRVRPMDRERLRHEGASTFRDVGPKLSLFARAIPGQGSPQACARFVQPLLYATCPPLFILFNTPHSTTLVRIARPQDTRNTTGLKPNPDDDESIRET